MSRLYNILKGLFNKTEFVIENKTVSLGTITANGTKSGSENVEKSGYKAISFAGWGNAGSVYFYAYQITLSEDNKTITVAVKSVSNSAINNAGVVVPVLYQKLP